MKKMKDDNFLLYVPKRKHNTWEVRNENVCLIFHHEKLSERFVRWLVKKSSVSDIELDEMGSLVWNLIDGERSVYDIGQELVKTAGEKCEPVYERLVLYLRYLYRRGWASFERGNQQAADSKVFKANSSR